MKDENIDLFDRYLTKEMPDEETRTFEKQLQSDSELRNEFDAYAMVVNTSRLGGENLFRRKLSAMHEDFFQEDVKPKGRVIAMDSAPRIWLIAASVVAIAGLAILFFTSESSSSQKLFAANMSAYSIVASPRGDVEEDSNWKSFIQQYESTNYQGALASLEKIQEGSKPEYLVAFYKGICLLSVSPPHAKKALLEFEIVLNSSNNFHEQSMWYKGLAYLQLEQKEKAIASFELLQNSGNFKNEEVKKLIETLN